MRIRPVDSSGDYVVGRPFLVNTREGVRLLIYSRLRLWQGDWFADTSDGTPYLQQVLAERYGKNPDAAVKNRIRGTTAVTQISSYASTFTGSNRQLSIEADVDTLYGIVKVATTVQVPST